MSKPYDAATKRLIELRPLDWVQFFGLPTGPVQLVDVDLSTVSIAADRLVRVNAKKPYILHQELESGKDGAALPERLLRYNVNVFLKTQLTVKSAVLLLRKESDSPALTGQMSIPDPEEVPYLWFKYTVVRVWQLDPETLLTGGLSVLPLAPIANVQTEALPSLIRRMDVRIEAEASSETEAAELWTATNILMGLRYDRERKSQLLQGVRRMRESITYQEILDEGREEGIEVGRATGALEEARRMVLRAGLRRLGVASTEVEAKVNSIASVEVLESLLDRIFDVETWDDLLRTLPTP